MNHVPETFGRLTTLGPVFKWPRPKAPKQLEAWQEVRCECGTIKSVLRSNLVSDNTRSCGCLCLELKQMRATHGHCKEGKKTQEFTAYRSMLARCYDKTNKHYPNYGGRGIGVWSEWLGPGGFERWLAHIGLKPSPELSQERKDVNKGYEPGNVCWATDEEQCNNRRSNVWITHNNETQTLAQWSKQTGIKGVTIKYRLNSGWTIEEALTKPVRRRQTGCQT